MGGLQRLWCANLTLLIVVVRAYENPAVSMMGLCWARPKQGPGHGWVGNWCSSIMCALCTHIITNSGAVFALSLLMMGRVHKPVVGSLYPLKIIFFLYITSHFSLAKTTLHPALHSIRMPMRDAIVMPGTMCSVSTVGRPGIHMSQMCVDVTLLPSGRLIVIGLFVLRRFLTGVPFIINIEVAPVSAMACVGAIVIVFAHSTFLYFVLQLDVIIVALLLSCGANAAS
jgi:hypothetical protein